MIARGWSLARRLFAPVRRDENWLTKRLVASRAEHGGGAIDDPDDFLWFAEEAGRLLGTTVSIIRSAPGRFSIYVDHDAPADEFGAIMSAFSDLCPMAMDVTVRRLEAT